MVTWVKRIQETREWWEGMESEKEMKRDRGLWTLQREWTWQCWTPTSKRKKSTEWPTRVEVGAPRWIMSYVEEASWRRWGIVRCLLESVLQNNIGWWLARWPWLWSPKWKWRNEPPKIKWWKLREWKEKKILENWWEKKLEMLTNCQKIG